MGLHQPPRWNRSAAVVLSALAYGIGTSLIPSPDSVSTFWVSNLAAPWLLLTAIAGTTQQVRWRSALVGAVAAVACVVGFYGHGLYRALFPSDALRKLYEVQDESLSAARARETAEWLVGISHWVAIAVVAGIVYGAIGCWWNSPGRSRRNAMLLIALPFVLEPLYWPLRTGRYQGPAVIWVVEVAVGLGIGALALSPGRRPALLRSRAG